MKNMSNQSYAIKKKKKIQIEKKIFYAIHLYINRIQQKIKTKFAKVRTTVQENKTKKYCNL
jgi:hypothetical protein